MMNLAKTSRDLEELWETFLEKRDPKARAKLAENYLYLVKIVLGRMLSRFPSHLEREDLEQIGVIGLLQALDRFRPGKGARFETYALSRIRGAILDYLRSLDPLTRQERKEVKEVIKVWQKLEEESGEPSLEQLAESMGMPVEEVVWLIEREKSSFLLSLEEERESENLLGEGRGHFLSPEEFLENKELMTYLGRAIDELPEREKLILALYYFEGLTLKEIGKVLSIGESRISQILARTIAKLRVKLEEWEGRNHE
ncbi:MAG: FliA/WhiG family RNA polymerase sigma factor [Atribacterota bacterium]|nr:FliA/WhiG family RNA polymerase sigma factor [Atribacterota bacterium]